jgi:hypothetical protein
MQRFEKGSSWESFGLSDVVKERGVRKLYRRFSGGLSD